MPQNRWTLALLAATTCSIPAWAASSVTLYGVADTGPGTSRYSWHGGSGAHASISHTGLRSSFLNDSEIGVKGREDLGGGTQALFRLESAVDLNTGASKSTFWDRHAWVGLSNPAWGTFSMGRQPDVSKDFVDLTTVKGLGKIERAFGGKGTRRSGIFKYVSPLVAGAQFGAGYARRTDDLKNFYNLGAKYANGPFSAVATYGWAKKEGQNYAVKDWLIGGSWDFRVAKVLAAYGQDRNGKFKTAGDVKASDFGGNKALMQSVGLGAYEQKGFRSNNYFLAAQAPLGPGKLGASWSYSTSNLGHFGYDSASQTILAAMYVYDLSKRTALYGYGAWGKGIAYVDGLKAREFGLGLRHKF